ncbi:MAG: hypothetical protein EBR26_04045, partial [Microbacteriaceae bacterium]|nr:hypothetical protein [Microbacteriaceae bacterium]
MKFLRSVLIAILAIVSPTVSPASAEDYFYWPDFGTFAQHNDWGYEYVHAPQAHQAGVTGKGIKIAILDDGLAAYAPGLANKVVAYRDFLPGQAKQSEHGTMVASTIASDYDPTVGIGGIAPGASLMVARVCFRGGCEWDAIRNALAWAVEEGADVISMSFTGYPEPYMNSNILNAVNKGIVVVASMGNSGCGPYSAWGISPYCLPTRVTESTQAGYLVAGVIAVGASDHKGGRVATLGWSSSFGPNHDI